MNDSRDLALAQELSTTWEDVFREELESGDLATTKSWLRSAIEALDKQDATIGRLKLAFGVSLVAILCLSGAYILTKNNKNDVGRWAAIPEQKVPTDNLEPTLQKMAKKFEWIEDPVEKQLRKLQEQQ